jgi:magnesium transporter
MTANEDICPNNQSTDDISSSNTDSEHKKKLQYKISEEKKCQLQKLIKRRKWKAIKEFLVKWPAATIADLIQEMDKIDAVLIFRCLPRDFAADVFSEVNFLDQDALLKDLTDSEITVLLTELHPDDRTELFEELPAPVTQRLLKLLKPEDLKEARLLLGYPEDSVGRLMTPDFVSIQEDWTVKKALKYIREEGRDSEILAMIYVVDKHGKLLDELRLRQLILANPAKKISDLMNYSYVGITAFEDQEKAYHLIKEYNLFALPVVDSEGILLGIVTVDDLIDVGEEETTEDFHKIAAMSELKLPERIRFAPVSTLFRKRIGWLMFLIFVNLFAGLAIALFEETIATYIVLLTFMPLLIGCGGNAGAQASTLMIRALAMKDVKLSDWYYCIGKEALVAGSLGLTLAIIVSFLGIVRGGLQIAVVVGLSMLIIVFVGSIVGISLPFIFTRLKWDPAVASGPLITSIADIIGIVIYLFIATSLLSF